VKADIWELVLEHLKEHGEEVVDGSANVSCGFVVQGNNVLLLAEDRGESTDLGPESGSNVLRSIRHKVFNSGHDVV
jgi:hypothetical protein